MNSERLEKLESDLKKMMASHKLQDGTSVSIKKSEFKFDSKVDDIRTQMANVFKNMENVNKKVFLNEQLFFKLEHSLNLMK